VISPAVTPAVSRSGDDGLQRSARPAWLWPVLWLIAIVAAALRIAAAQGGLWLDEAWSAVFARDVGSAAGVFLHINHDNNHHLNTLWLQLVGFDAPPPIQRGLSIASGAAAVLVAGAIGARRSAATALVTAWLFALSPILVTYGSEARGYAPMVLALLGAFLLIDRWLDDRRQPPLTVALAIIFLLGLLAQLTMVFAIAALTAWVVLRLWQQDGFRAAARDGVRLLAAPLAVATVTVAAVLWLLPGREGFQFGAYMPPRIEDLIAGYAAMLRYTTGLDWAGPALLLLIVLVRRAGWRDALDGRHGFYLLAILAVPIAMAALQLGNTGMPRYHLLAAVALLLVAGESAAATFEGDRISGTVAAVLLAGFTVASLIAAAGLFRDQRADPGRAIAVLMAAELRGTTVALDRERASAVIEAGAASRHYPARIGSCGRWLFVDRDGTEPFEAVPRRCGRRYRPVAEAHPTGLSGTHWRLYRTE
jgi:uncharacterized membrane protein